jgi:glucosylceramidase
VKPGSLRIASNKPATLPNVAYKTPNGDIVLIVLNDGNDSQTFTIANKNSFIKGELSAGAVGTYVLER